MTRFPSPPPHRAPGSAANHLPAAGPTPPSGSVSSPAIDILFVCTGNTCRSPMAATLLDARLRDLGFEARVHSAGTIGSGHPAAPEAVAVMAARGFDTSGHRSRRVTPDMAQGADIVIGLAREHVREIVASCPGAWPRVFTLKELVRRGEVAGPRRAGEAVGEWLATLHAGRRPSDLLVSSADDDVADPIGRPRGAHERTAVELDDLTARLARLLAEA